MNKINVPVCRYLYLWVILKFLVGGWRLAVGGWRLAVGERLPRYFEPCHIGKIATIELTELSCITHALT